MDFSYLLTSLNGRIARKPFWLAIVALAVAIAFLVLNAVLPVEPALLIVTILMLHPAVAPVVKPLHDHGHPAMPLAFIFIAPSVTANLLQVVGLTTTTIAIGGATVPTLTPLGWLVQIVVLIVGVWALLLLGFKRGEEMDNAYGPDPVAG